MPAAAAAPKAAHITEHIDEHHLQTYTAPAESRIAISRLPLLIPAAAALKLLYQAAIVPVVRLHGGCAFRMVQSRHIVAQTRMGYGMQLYAVAVGRDGNYTPSYSLVLDLGTIPILKNQ